MIRALLGKLSGRLGRSSSVAEESDASGEGGDDDKSQFMPSQLDASVLEAHGMETTAAERELAQLQESAEQLE